MNNQLNSKMESKNRALLNYHPKILIVDDDEETCRALRCYLERATYQANIAHDGFEGMKLFDNILPDLVLTDLMMPNIDGLELCQYIKRKRNCSVILLSAKGEPFDKVVGLDSGADDYIAKPFDFKEVLARIKAVLRRSNLNKRNIINSDFQENNLMIKYDNLIIDMLNYTVYINGKAEEMPPKEIKLLNFLARRPNQVFSRDEILDQLWGADSYVYNRTIDVHIKRLRKRLSGISNKWALKTVWGVGYKFEVYLNDKEINIDMNSL